MNLEYACWSYTASSIICCGLAFHYLTKHIPLFNKEIIPIYNIRKMLRFSIPMVFSIFLGNLSRQIDILMLGLFVSATELGIYSPAVRIIMIAEFIYLLFNPIFNPVVAELCAKKDFLKLGNLLQVITRWTFTMSLPVFMILFFYPEAFLNLFGHEYISASPVLRVLVAVHLCSSISSLPSSMIFMSGRSDITVKNNTLILVLNVTLN